jgi:hypothetical protein
MNTKPNSNLTVSTNLKQCPFCGDGAAVIQGSDGLFAVQCEGCKASTGRSNQTAEVAVMWWQIRLGSPSYAGGAATKGLTTPKKASASRRNLELARAAKRLKQPKCPHACVGTR